MNIQPICDAYTQLKPETIPDLIALYHDQATFQDPFNRVRGHAAIARIFEHMFETVDSPKFDIIDCQQQDQTAWLSWVFRLQFRGDLLAIEGVSRLDFASDGRVMNHRDYWDASELYERLPLLGKILGYLRSRLQASQRQQSTEFNQLDISS